MGFARRTQFGLDCVVGAALCIAVNLAMANEPDIDRLVQKGDRCWLVGQDADSCRILNTVTGEHAQVVRTAIGQLNEYLAANYGVSLPAESGASLSTQGSWIVAAVGSEPSGVLDLVGPVENIGDQGFVIRQVAARLGMGRLLIVWGKTPLGCRYGLIELMRSLQSEGNACFTELTYVRDEPTFPRRTYYHNFGEHLLNAYSVNVLHDVPFARWTRADWRRFLEMIAAMRYTTYELWLSPTFFAAESLTAGAGSKFDAYADTIRAVIDDAHELGLQVEILVCVNCTEPTWVNLCPRLPDEHDKILALWSHWTKQLSNADVFGIFPGDVGGCHRNGCTHETFLDLCLEIIHNTAANGSFRFEICTWGAPFFDWGVPAREATAERAKAAFDCLLRRTPEFPQDTSFSVNMHWDINHLFSGAPRDPLHSNRAVVDELRQRAPVMTWDYYLSEREDAATPLYCVPALFEARREEREWGYCGGINYTRTPRLNVLTAFAAAEAYWNPDQTETDVLRNFSCYVFGSPELAPAVFPAVATVGQPNWSVFQESMRRASQVLKTAQAPKLCKLFVTPSADTYRESLLSYTTIYERLARIALQVQEVVLLSGKTDINAVKEWLSTAPESQAKSRVQEMVAGWSDFDLSAVVHEYRTRVYGVYDLAVGSDVRADLVNSHCQAFVAPFGIAEFFETSKAVWYNQRSEADESVRFRPSTRLRCDQTMVLPRSRCHCSGSCLPVHFVVAGSLAALMLACASVAQDAAPVPEKVEFNRDVRPILSDNCFFCHGPDAGHREADLRLDVREDALESAAFVPGQPAQSALIERILADDPEERMPPPDSRKELTDRQKEILKLWIEQGAQYQRHWAYEPPVKADIATGQNGVDVLVSRRLAEVGLQPSPEADRRTLIRRLYWDLIGLPPTPAEVAAFENDSSPGAYENLVDRLLQNPHYGERMAIAWLDVVRFADTIGYHSDNPRNIWPYRDWVIQSFNDNKPFDRFTIEQIAGDLLPDASQQTRVGSAFNRLLLTTEEGGAQAKDYEARMVADRVRVIGTAWLGQTTGCAQCHDHKFDPFTTRDFYALGAFFADIQEPILGRREDGMTVVTPEQEQRLATLDAARAEAAKAFEAVVPQLDVAQKQWEADIVAYDVTLPELRPESQAAEAAKQAARQVMDILKLKDPSRSPQQQQVVQDYFRGTATQLFAVERDAVAKAERERREYYDSLPKCLVSVRTPDKRIVRILPRGNWMDESGEVVKPALPHYLPQPAIDGRELTRLDLAQWLVSRDNPLTARTAMNRLWKQFFGAGLSKVLSDLGAQGEPPANPALLDWLACEFMDGGWDMQHMVRTIVTSATYRQVSTATPELMAADPYNRECARQNAFRLDAELVRDTALAVSGLLVPSIGGPSVKPYQPDRYWENLNFPPRDYVPDTGDSQYRRGLYVWWQRTFLHPSLWAFDAPSREECAAERGRSNIPQQALVLLNDPTYVEAARSLAARVLRECNGAPEERLVRVWQLALQRNPRQGEVQTMLELLELHRSAYRADPQAAEALLKSGFSPVPGDMDKVELAAWTHVARVLLNLHETITRS